MIKILTVEESKEFHKAEREAKLKYTIEDIINEAKLFQSLPDGGNTKYIIGHQMWAEWYEWLLTEEAMEQWKQTTSVLELAKYFTLKLNIK